MKAQGIVIAVIALALLAPAISVAANQAVPNKPAPPPPPAVANGGGSVDELVENDLKTLEDPSLSSPVRKTDLQAVLEATQSNSSAAIEFGLESRERPDLLRATFKLAGPISQNTDRSELATLKGLSDQTSLTFGFRSQRRSREEIRQDVVNKLTAAIARNPLAFRKDLEAAWKAENPGQPIPAALSTDDLSSRGRRKFLRSIGATGGTPFFASEATYAAPKQFDFAIRETLERRKEEHDGYSGTISLGWLPVVSPLPYLGISYVYEDSFKEQSQQQICEPLGSSNSLGCRNLVLGAPKHVEKQLLQLEVRRYSSKATAAFGLRLTRDLKNDVTGVELPVWMIPDSSGLLNGGVSAGWRSDTKEWTLSVFVGSPFGKK